MAFTKDLFRQLVWHQHCRRHLGVLCGLSPRGGQLMPPPCKAPPAREVDLPLGQHLLPATRDKMCNGECMELLSILFRELEKKDKADLDERDNEKFKNLNVDRTWSNWLAGYFIYTRV